VAIEAADVIFMADDLAKLPVALELSRRTLRTVKQNIVAFALVFNAGAVAAAATGYLSPVAAAIVHQVSSLLVVSNSLRLLAVGKAREAVGEFAAQRLWEPLRARRATILRGGVTIAVAVYAGAGFYSIQPGQLGLVRRFGRPLDTPTGPGLHYHLPWPVDKLTRVQLDLVRTVDIGFRANARALAVEPRVYEWGIQHEIQKFEGQADESTIVTGDANMLQINAVAQYRVAPRQAQKFAFGLFANPEALIRDMTEAALRLAIGERKLEDILTTHIHDVEQEALGTLNDWLKAYDVGIVAIDVFVEDIHPPLEIVDAYRSVSTAREDKDRLINEAKGEASERVILAKGRAAANVEKARADAAQKGLKAQGDAARFDARDAAYREAPEVTKTRLFLETIEKVFPQMQVTIVDANHRGRNRITFLRPEGLAKELKPLLEQLPSASLSQSTSNEEGD